MPAQLLTVHGRMSLCHETDSSALPQWRPTWRPTASIISSGHRWAKLTSIPMEDMEVSQVTREFPSHAWSSCHGSSHDLVIEFQVLKQAKRSKKYWGSPRFLTLNMGLKPLILPVSSHEFPLIFWVPRPGCPRCPNAWWRFPPSWSPGHLRISGPGCFHSWISSGWWTSWAFPGEQKPKRNGWLGKIPI